MQKLDDRCIFNFRDRSLIIVADTVSGCLVKFKLAPDDFFHRLGSCRRTRIHQLQDLVVLCNHPVNAQLGRKLDLVNRLLVRRIRSGDGQAVIALAQYDDAIGLADLAVEKPFREAVGVNCVKVNQRCRIR